MWNVVQFPPARIRDRSSGVRAAFVADHWCVERLEAGEITMRNLVPSQADAQRITARISRRDKVPVLAPCLPRPPRRTGGHYTPDDAA
jgi:hypothetical protein